MSRSTAPHARFSQMGGAHSAWGGELGEFALATVWRPADWTTAEDDDLVFYLPSLASSHSGLKATGGAVEHLVKILKARVRDAAMLMSATMEPPLALSAAVELLISTATLTQLTASECVVGRRAGAAAEAGAETDRDRKLLLVDLIAIARVDRMLLDALDPSGCRSDKKHVIDWPLSFTDVVAATVHSRINGAYVYPRHAYAHETLTVAAIIGHLLHGRAAYINRTIAGCIVDSIPAYVDPTGGSAYAALWHYAEIACGAEQLFELARRVLASNRPELAKPRTSNNLAPAHLGPDARVARRIHDAGMLTYRVD